ncbi:MAG: HigA family addiction module antitoxin [Bacteroidales bacterium]|jgi:addiction module HigA family antidote|nr:HigA family addiction module antitoxin [Bacteroidales bacterium]
MVKQNQFVPQVVFHPGETLDEKLKEMGMGPKEFAFRAGKPEKTITAILKAESSITADMAVQFESVTKIPAHFWLNAQRVYDEFIAREKRMKVIESAVEWANEFPVSQMNRLGWLEKSPTKQGMAAQLLSFFGVATPSAWENYYYNQQLKVAFRISLKHTREPFAISAWLRKGELSAQQISATPYSEKGFRESLPAIKSFMAAHPDDFFEKLQNICLTTGVKVIYTPFLSKAPINGATRWINDSPVIQVTGRGKRNDKFWFSFFHESGHILLHGKKDIFLEQIDYQDKDEEKERNADEFAVKWTFSKEEEAAFNEKIPFTEQELIEYAQKINTHPAMIIGRLQFQKKIPYSFGQRFFVPIDLSET